MGIVILHPILNQENHKKTPNSSVDLDLTFSGKRFQSGSTDPTTHTPSKQLAHAATMATLLVSIISDLMKNVNLANEMLANEGQLVHDTELKLRIKDLEGATGPIPMQGQTTSKPSLSKVQSQGSNEEKDSLSPLGGVHTEKHEDTRQG